MSALEKFDRFNKRFSYLVEWVGLAGLLLMMFITCIDVIGAKIFRLPVPGAIDYVMLAQLFAVSFAIAASLLLGRHVEVEFFVPLLPAFARAIVECISSAVRPGPLCADLRASDCLRSLSSEGL